jgi:ABC-type nitrate/sulfonate/bicarbonate transport system permease component
MSPENGGVKRWFSEIVSDEADSSVISVGMRFLRQCHLYLGCLFAPILIFFAVTGAWQVFDWHQSQKDGSYVAPRTLRVLSSIHKDAHIPPTRRSSPAPVRYFMFAAALGLVLTTVIGVIMAYRFSRQPLVATICLAIGALLPAVLLWVYR